MANAQLASQVLQHGRLIAGNAGVLVSRVITVKTGVKRIFVVLDAAMNDLIRPTLYGVYHDIRAVRPRPGEQVATIVGPVCETGDMFAEDRPLPPLAAPRRSRSIPPTMAGASRAAPSTTRRKPNGHGRR